MIPRPVVDSSQLQIFPVDRPEFDRALKASKTDLLCAILFFSL